MDATHFRRCQQKTRRLLAKPKPLPELFALALNKETSVEEFKEALRLASSEEKNDLVLAEMEFQRGCIVPKWGWNGRTWVGGRDNNPNGLDEECMVMPLHAFLGVRLRKDLLEVLLEDSSYHQWEFQFGCEELHCSNILHLVVSFFNCACIEKKEVCENLYETVLFFCEQAPGQDLCAVCEYDFDPGLGWHFGNEQWSLLQHLVAWYCGMKMYGGLDKFLKRLFEDSPKFSSSVSKFREQVVKDNRGRTLETLTKFMLKTTEHVEWEDRPAAKAEAKACLQVLKKNGILVV